MQTAHLENWWITFFGRKDTIQLNGDVTGHPRLPDGMDVHTSVVKEINVPEGYAITLNTRYTLGKIDEGFAEACPEAATMVKKFEPEGY